MFTKEEIETIKYSLINFKHKTKVYKIGKNFI